MLDFWYFWVKPKVRRKSLQTSACAKWRRFSAARAEASAGGGPPQRRALRSLRPAFLADSLFSALSFEERAKEGREAKMVGKPPRTSLNDHKRLRCFARSFRALGVLRLLHPTFSHCGNRQACGLLKKYKNTRSHNPANRLILASHRNLSFSQAEGLHNRTAKSAEKVAATARAPGAGVRNSEVFRARSASDGDVTRNFSPCLTFWYFWVKPKVRRKLLPALACTKTGQLVSQTSPHKFFLLFLSKKEPKKTARRKWSGSRRTPR